MAGDLENSKVTKRLGLGYMKSFWDVQCPLHGLHFHLLSDVTSRVDSISISYSLKIVTSWADIMIHEKVLPAVEEQPGFQLWSLPFSKTLEEPPGIRSTQLPPPGIFKDDPTQG